MVQQASALADRWIPATSAGMTVRRKLRLPIASAVLMNPSTDPALLPATELVALYRARKLSPVEATMATLARIERFNPIINAYCHLDADGALAAAKESEARWAKGAPKGLVDGVPVGVKDNILIA